MSIRRQPPTDQHVAPRLAIGSLIAIALALGGFTFSGPADAATATTATSPAPTQAAAVLAQFRAELAADASSDPVAAANLAKFDTLTAAQRNELAQYLLGNAGAPSSSAQSIGPGLAAPRSAAAAATTTYTVYSTGDQETFLVGILIAKTRVWANYVTGSGRVLSISSYGCQVVNNYDPFSKITTSKAGSSLSSGSATFLCNVVVKRGVPTPWGQVTWSTESALQYLSVNGSGITGNGWK